MKRGVAIAIGASAIFHVTALIVLDGVDPPDRRKPRDPLALSLQPIEIQTSTPPPIDVAMIPETPVAAAAPAQIDVAPTPTSRPAATSPRIATSPTALPATGATAASEPDRVPDRVPDVPARPGMLSMRGTEGDRGTDRPTGPVGRGHLAALGLGSLRGPESFEYDPNGPQPYVPPDSGELHPSGGGTHRSRRPGFTGHVDQDGHVTMKDKEAFKAHWRLPNPKTVAKSVAQGIEEWYRDPWEQVRAQEVDKATCHKGGGDGVNNCLTAGDSGSTGAPLEGAAKYAARAQTDGEKGDDAVTIPIIGGSTEITDWVMRKVGMDPYQADKLRWMDATRDERVEIGRVHRRKQLDKVDQIMRKHIHTLWARTDLDLAAKREALFELWDDGAEDGESAVVEAAQRTRNQVIGFIRAKLPASSPGAYTAAEVEALNRRRTSRTRFTPY